MSSKEVPDIKRRTLLGGGALATGTMLLPGWARAAGAYPSQAVSLIVPFPPGGTVDTVTRLLSEVLAERMGQPIVVDNRGGASGAIGAKHVAQAKPDGYTVMITASNQIINPLMVKNVSYDPVADFTPICYIGYVPQLLVVRSDFPANSLEEFVKLAKEHGDTYNWATSALGTAGHLAEELINQSTGIKLPVVPYRGGGPALVDVIAGHVTAMVEPVPSSYPHVKSGRLKILAVTSPKRASILPDVPTVAEQGVPGFALPSWYGMWGPSGMEDATVRKIQTEVKAALQSDALKERLDAIAFEVIGGTPEDLKQMMETETVKYTEILRNAGIEPS